MLTSGCGRAMTFHAFVTIVSQCEIRNHPWITLVYTNIEMNFYRQDAAKRQTAGIKFTHRPKIRVFAPRCTDSRQTWQGWRARGSAWLCKISPQSSQEGGCTARKYQKFALGRFLKFLAAFIQLTIQHQCFKFDVIHFTGYGVIAEKPRVRQLGQFFSVHHVRKTMRWIE